MFNNLSFSQCTRNTPVFRVQIKQMFIRNMNYVFAGFMMNLVRWGRTSSLKSLGLALAWQSKAGIDGAGVHQRQPGHQRGTKINAFVYNTIAQWYNEDAKVAALTPCRATGWAPALQGSRDLVMIQAL